MLTFMFFVNMLGAIILLPALAAWLVRPKSPPDHHDHVGDDARRHDSNDHDGRSMDADH